MISASVLSAFVVHLNNPASVTLQSLKINLRFRPSLTTCIRLSGFISSSLCHHCTSPVASSISQARTSNQPSFDFVRLTLMRPTPNTPEPKQSLTNLKLKHKIYSLHRSYKPHKTVNVFSYKRVTLPRSVHLY
uniref:Uncharacterized protein n=1 Tax=Glossina pallidipes TaxID=7398 RepID=A0A1A9Z1Y1_GLOPL